MLSFQLLFTTFIKIRAIKAQSDYTKRYYKDLCEWIPSD